MAIIRTKLSGYRDRLQTHADRLRLHRGPREMFLYAYNRLMIRAGGWLPGKGKVVPVGLTAVHDVLYARLGTTDWLVIEEIFIDGEYEPVIREHLANVRQIIDLGANAGYSLRFWQLNFPEAQIIAVEPDASNLRIARLNAGPNANVAFAEACVAASPGRVSLDRSNGEWGISMRHDAVEVVGSVEALTMPQLFDRFDVRGDVDILKCDVEGAERELFRDCRGWIDRVRVMIVELHDGYRDADLLGDLDRNGASFGCTIISSSPTVQVLLLKNGRFPPD